MPASLPIHSLKVGDFNSTPPSIPISLLRSLGGLSDSFLYLNPQLSWESVSLLPSTTTSTNPNLSINDSNLFEARRSIKELGVTCDSPLNTWTSGKPLDSNAIKGSGKRLDYIFWRSPEESPQSTNQTHHHHPEVDEESYELLPIQTSVTFLEKIPGLGISYSDHFGLETTFKIQLKSPSILTSETQTLAQLENSPNLLEILNTSSTILSSALLISRIKQKKYLSFFALILTMALGLIVFSILGNGGLWNGVYCLLAIVMGWGGTTLLYSGVIWSEWERSEYSKGEIRL